MRAANYSSMNIFNKEQIKQINSVIKENFIEGKDDAAADSHKTSNVKFVNLGKIQKYIYPFIDFCLTANNNFYTIAFCHNSHFFNVVSNIRN